MFVLLFFYVTTFIAVSHLPLEVSSHSTFDTRLKVCIHGILTRLVLSQSFAASESYSIDGTALISRQG